MPRIGWLRLPLSTTTRAGYQTERGFPGRALHPGSPLTALAAFGGNQPTNAPLFYYRPGKSIARAEFRSERVIFWRYCSEFRLSAADARTILCQTNLNGGTYVRLLTG